MGRAEGKKEGREEGRKAPVHEVSPAIAGTFGYTIVGRKEGEGMMVNELRKVKE